MSFSAPSSFFETLVENATKQSGAGSTLPASFHGENPSGFAVAHLNKADVFVDSGEAYCSVLFEVVTFAEWGFVKSGQPAGYLPLPDEWNPVLIELERTRLAALLPVLGLTEQNFEDGLLAEGAWFGFVVERYLNGAVSGTLYSEWGEEEPTQIQIPSGALIALPAIDADGFMTLELPPNPLSPFVTQTALGTLFIHPGGPSFAGLSQEKAEAVTTSDTVVSVGVMDIGTGGCNMLIADDQSVFGYFDAGLPTNMHRRSMPVALLTLLTNGGSVPAPQYYVLLSHWDWDHWYLGRQSGLTGCQWIVPGQPIGAKSGQFSAKLRALGLQKIFDLPFDSSGNIAVARCEPRWQPPFVTALTPDDRCHLNGLAVADERVRFVTAFGATDSDSGWRNGKNTGGIVIDVDSGEIVASGFCMPHSPRWHDGHLWVADSGKGTLVTIDQRSGQPTVVAQFPGSPAAWRSPADMPSSVSRRCARPTSSAACPWPNEFRSASAASGFSISSPAAAPAFSVSRTPCRRSSTCRSSRIGIQPCSIPTRRWSTRSGPCRGTS